MADTFLAELGLSPSRIMQLQANERSRLLNFLERWDYPEDLHACLDHALDERPDLVSLLDLKVRAYVAEERYDEALALNQRRLELRSSISPRAMRVHVVMTQGDLATAESLVESLLENAPESMIVWRLKGQLALQRGDLEAATAAFHRLGELRPQSRSFLLSMMRLYEAQDDWVTASGYAVRVMNTAETPEELPATTLRTLLAYFRASKEETRARQIGEALEARYAWELDELKGALGAYLPKDETATPVTPGTEPTVKAEPGAAEAQDLAVEPVPVTDQERELIERAVRRTFGFEKLLPGQLETMAAVLRDENVLTILPTGGGKSLCYQLPALLAEEGTTLVISPLIALMKDQVDSLPEKLRDRATTINSSLDGDVLSERLARAARGEYRLLYAAPERLRQPIFLHALRRAGINRLVIDEAHCVSVWGHDFRPDYLKLSEAWTALGEPPILALTATAPPRVRRDIVQHLSPDRPMAVVVGNVFRPNLQLELFHASNIDEKIQRLIAFCHSNPGSGIVYADTRDRCEQLATLLRSQGVDADHYHAGIPNRDEVQDAFMSGKTRVIVATIAFGMGIDKPDIRFIVHFRPPASLESYYQEAGRAGRDGLPARCLLMYAPSDQSVLTRRVRRDLPTIEFLRHVYAAAYRYLGEQSYANVASIDLERDLDIDDTQLRVALSILEENELLRRGPDIPRTALVRIRARHDGNGATDASLQAFCTAARCRPDQWQQLNLVHAAQEANLAVETIEDTLLTWQHAGWLNVRFSGRDMLLARTSAPDDAAQRINLWVDGFAAIQEQRIGEIVAYATTDHCRHGHLSAYLGGTSLDQCGACDNCVPLSPKTGVAFPEDHEQLAAILACISKAPWSWGRRSLISILQGNHDAPAKAVNRLGFADLSFRSKSAIDSLIADLLSHELLTPRQLDHGGVVLDLTPAGRKALEQPASLKEITEPPPPPSQLSQPTAGPGDDPGKQVDQAIFNRLRGWRRKEAKQQGIPPYLIFKDNDLRRIAMVKPQSPEALLGVKGVGARKLELYGDAVLKIIRRAMAQVGDSAE